MQVSAQEWVQQRSRGAGWGLLCQGAVGWKEHWPPSPRTPSMSLVHLRAAPHQEVSQSSTWRRAWSTVSPDPRRSCVYWVYASHPFSGGCQRCDMNLGSHPRPQQPVPLSRRHSCHPYQRNFSTTYAMRRQIHLYGGDTISSTPCHLPGWGQPPHPVHSPAHSAWSLPT